MHIQLENVTLEADIYKYRPVQPLGNYKLDLERVPSQLESFLKPHHVKPEK